MNIIQHHGTSINCTTGWYKLENSLTSLSVRYCHLTFRDKMPSILPIRVVCILSILAGFTTLSWRVSKDYFGYRTTSVVTIQDIQGDVVAPAVVFCFRFNLREQIESTIGELFNFFNDQDDTWKVLRWRLRVTLPEKPTYLVKKYYTTNRYCIFVKVVNHVSMEEVTSPRVTNPTFYNVRITATPALSPNSFPIRDYVRDKTYVPKPIFFQVLSDEAILPNRLNRLIRKPICTKGYPFYRADLTYSSSVKVKLPPPYDTNCRNYSEDSPFLSRYNCYDQCFKKQTIAYNVVPDMTIIDKETYNQSTAHIVPWDVLEGQGLKTLKPISESLQDSYRKVRSKWQDIKNFCRESCNRADCISEKISPRISSFEGWQRKGNATLHHITAFLRTPYQPIIQVSSIPKEEFIDYIVYLFSMLSFWLGYCPLTLTNKLLRRLQVCITRRKKMDISVKAKLRSLEAELRRIKEQYEFAPKPFNSQQSHR